jgi:hypothetical protein
MTIRIKERRTSIKGSRSNRIGSRAKQETTVQEEQTPTKIWLIRTNYVHGLKQD